MELKFCKDCARAKHKTEFNRDMWYRGKHRQYITEFTTIEMYRKDDRPCLMMVIVGENLKKCKPP